MALQICNRNSRKERFRIQHSKSTLILFVGSYLGSINYFQYARYVPGSVKAA